MYILYVIHFKWFESVEQLQTITITKTLHVIHFKYSHLTCICPSIKYITFDTKWVHMIFFGWNYFCEEILTLFLMFASFRFTQNIPYEGKCPVIIEDIKEKIVVVVEDIEQLKMIVQKRDEVIEEFKEVIQKKHE